MEYFVEKCNKWIKTTVYINTKNINQQTYNKMTYLINYLILSELLMFLFLLINKEEVKKVICLLRAGEVMNRHHDGIQYML